VSDDQATAAFNVLQDRFGRPHAKSVWYESCLSPAVRDIHVSFPDGGATPKTPRSETGPRNPASRRLTEDQFRDLSNPAPGVVADLLRLLNLTLV
jgi:hypothetical protein